MPTVQLVLKKWVQVLNEVLTNQLRDAADSHIPQGRQSAAVFN
jgi:hypothetical protein